MSELYIHSASDRHYFHSCSLPCAGYKKAKVALKKPTTRSLGRSNGVWCFVSRSVATYQGNLYFREMRLAPRRAD